MKLSAVLLREELSQYIILWKYGSFSDQLNLRHPEYYWQQPVFLSGHVYIASAEELPEKPQTQSGACLICIGQPDEVYFTEDISLLIVSRHNHIQALFNLLHTIYETYDEWDRALQECINKELALQKIVDLSEPVLKNPINVADRHYHFLAVSRKKPQYAALRTDISVEDINMLKEEPDFQALFREKYPRIIHSKSINHRLLAYIIRTGGEFSAVISLGEIDRPLREADRALLMHMSYYIALLYEKSKPEEQNRLEVLAGLAGRILEGNPPPEPELRRQLAPDCWQISHSYRLYVLGLSRKDREFNIMRRLCRKLEEQLVHTVAFSFRDHIVVVGNLSLSPERNQLNQVLVEMGQAGKWKIASCPPLAGIHQLREGYVQASFALDMGLDAHPEQNWYDFSDYRMAYLLKNCCGELSAEHLCPDGLSALIAHDREKGTQYVRTLKCWFENDYNATRTAKALFIHRSTFLDRMERIREIGKLDLDDPGSKLHLMLMLQVLVAK